MMWKSANGSIVCPLHERSVSCFNSLRPFVFSSFFSAFFSFLFLFFLSHFFHFLLCCQQWQGWCRNPTSSSAPSPSFAPGWNGNDRSWGWNGTNNIAQHMKNIIMKLRNEINLVETVLVCYVIDKNGSCII